MQVYLAAATNKGGCRPPYASSETPEANQQEQIA